MMKVFICPDCGWMRVVSRRKQVECFKCGQWQMTLSKIDFVTYTEMSEQERKDYAEGWLYIHNRKMNKAVSTASCLANSNNPQAHL